MENVVVRYIGSGGQYQDYSQQDVALINTSLVNGSFGVPGDYIEYFIKDLEGNVVDVNYNATQYKIEGNVNSETGVTSQLYLDPNKDARDLGYNRGIFNVKYNFLRTQLGSAPNFSANFWIKEISTSRTEIKTARQDLSNSSLLDLFGAFNALLSADPYFPTFYLNFGQDRLVIGVNAAYVEEGEDSYIVFKLYEPLPDTFDVKSTFWVVTEVADSAEFNVAIEVAAEPISDTQAIKGPNFKVAITDRIGETTPYYNLASLFGTSVTSSFQQIQSLMQEKGIQINVDYSNFENFIHFSSATERLYNFVYKLQQIETASYALTLNNTPNAKVLLQKEIDNITTNFDGWEYYLYFDSGSTSWPKRTDRLPYQLYSVSSSQAINWLGSINIDPSPGVMSMYWSASNYDNQNKDWLIYATPQYILDDDANLPYVTFLNMIGQHFDNIWIYLKDVTNRYNANNNPFVGISMDQVAEAIKNFGVQLYTNTSISDNLYYSVLGINPTGSTLPVTSSQYSRIVFSSSSLYPPVGSTYLSASLLLPPIGEEKIKRYVVTMPFGSSTLIGFWNAPTSLYNRTTVYGGSGVNYGLVSPSLPGTQIQNEIYKRIYHNLPYLLKTRGTERGMRALIATYGVPSNILEPLEFGGYNYLEFPGIQEISQIRIMTGSVPEISSSLLSPFSTIQYYSNNMEKTSITVQAGFSPADSINASITSSGYVTSSTQPGYFNIMQLIGAPELQYSSSYIPLDQVSNTYFNAEYTRRYNVWDFIRLIKYYDNSLFKMLRDWVPARVSADTGIVIKSHMLERNKYPRKEPTVSTSSLIADYELLTVEGSSAGSISKNTNYVEAIPVQYNGTASIALTQSFGTVFVNSTNDVQKYTGEFSGSYIKTTTNYFSQEEVSSYIFPWTSSVPGNGDLFLTYSVSPLYQNIITPVRSERFLDLDFNTSQLAPVNYGLITKSLQDTVLYGNVFQSQQSYSQYAYIQDYNYTFRPSIIPRYSGSYLSGLYYNTYSVGDISYGKEPVINYHTDKLGLFVQVATSSFFPGRVNVALAYLADVSGGLFELNQNNRNWIDLQNIFVAGTTATVKQFDNKKYSNQVTTDGIKPIYNSGYNYTPQLYFRSGSGSPDTAAYFQYTGLDTDEIVRGYVSGSPNNYISGVPSPAYSVTLDSGTTVRAGKIYNYIDAENPTTTALATGSTSAAIWPSFTASIAGQRTFTVNLGISVEFQDPQVVGSNTVQFSWGAYKNDTTLIGIVQNSSFTSQYSAGGATLPGVIQGNAAESAVTVSGGPIGSLIELTGEFDVIIDGNTNSSINGTFTYGSYLVDIGGSGYIQRTVVVDVTGDLANYLVPYTSTFPPGATILTSVTEPVVGGPAVNIAQGTITLNYTTPAISLAPEDTVTFRFRQELSTTSNYTASFIPGEFNSYLVSTLSTAAQGNYPYANLTSSLPIELIADITDNQSVIVFNSEISSFRNYQYVPFFISGGVTYSSSLYDRYGDVNFPFNPQFGDAIVMSDFTGNIQELQVVSSSIQNNKLNIIVSPQVLDNWSVNPGLIYTFLLLKRYQDEQNILLTFNKNPGATSYGFLIPETINPGVIENINTLQAAVQSQLLNGQAPLPGGI